jgi:hypothetical protein
MAHKVSDKLFDVAIGKLDTILVEGPSVIDEYIYSKSISCSFDGEAIHTNLLDLSLEGLEQRVDTFRYSDICPQSKEFDLGVCLGKCVLCSCESRFVTSCQDNRLCLCLGECLDDRDTDSPPPSSDQDGLPGKCKRRLRRILSNNEWII